MVGHVALSMGNQQDAPEEEEALQEPINRVLGVVIPSSSWPGPARCVKPLALAFVVGLLTCFVHVHKLGLQRYKELTRLAQKLTA